MKLENYLDQLRDRGFACLCMWKLESPGGGRIDNYLLTKGLKNIPIIIVIYPDDRGFNVYPCLEGNNGENDILFFENRINPPKKENSFNAKSIRNFAYFTANFTHDFISKCWGDQPHMVSHLEEIFLGHAKGQFINCRDFMRFFFDLDAGNQEKLANWINENYQGI